MKVRVAPRAPRNRIAALTEQYLKVALKAPPVEGRANRELLHFLSRVLEVPEKRLRLRSGKGSRLKTLEIEGGEPGLLEKLETRIRRELSPEEKR